MKKKKERFVLILFPIRHPGWPGPWWIRAGNVCADSVPPHGYPEGQESRAKSPVGRDDGVRGGGRGVVLIGRFLRVDAICGRPPPVRHAVN